MNVSLTFWFSLNWRTISKDSFIMGGIILPYVVVSGCENYKLNLWRAQDSYSSPISMASMHHQEEYHSPLIRRLPCGYRIFPRSISSCEQISSSFSGREVVCFLWRWSLLCTYIPKLFSGIDNLELLHRPNGVLFLWLKIGVFLLDCSISQVNKSFGFIINGILTIIQNVNNLK